MMKTKAKGQFCTADFNVKNFSDKPVSWASSEQKLIDSEGRKQEPDITAMAYLNASDSTDTFGNINPGVSIDAKIAWDVAKDATFSSIEVHDSLFSNGARISLT